jgi:hypothetical protein
MSLKISMKDHLKHKSKKDKDRKKNKNKRIKNLKKLGSQNFPRFIKNKQTTVTSENKS